MTKKSVDLITFEATTLALWAILAGAYSMIGNKYGYIAFGVIMLVVVLKVLTIRRLAGKK